MKMKSKEQTSKRKKEMKTLFKELGSNILESGLAYRIPELRLKKRKQIGLPQLPKCNPDAIMKLVNAVSFSKKPKKGEHP